MIRSTYDESTSDEYQYRCFCGETRKIFVCITLLLRTLMPQSLFCVLHSYLLVFIGNISCSYQHSAENPSCIAIDNKNISSSPFKHLLCYSLESPLRKVSNNNQQHMFSWRRKKISTHFGRQKISSLEL